MERDNNKAKEYSKKFLDKELLGFFDIIEKDHLYGSLFHSKGERQLAEFVFNEGICLRCIEPLEGKNNVFMKSTKFW